MKKNESKYLLDLINAALIGESKKIELSSLALANSLKKEYPELAMNIQRAISSFSLNSGASIRSAGGSPLPVDGDTRLEMATLYAPKTGDNLHPILPEYIVDRVKAFLEERSKIETLLQNNVRPSTSLLLIGQPGTGKTMLARYIADALNKNLVVLDLSASVSSLMGKTGANLKKVLQYAKQNASVLLFDEFDAIAKKRDDNTDLGEIKRVVNVLLMELEDWPISSIFIATSNHPELLDKAIWRRFDHHLTLPIPENDERMRVLKRELENFLIEHDSDPDLLNVISEFFEGKSPADICKYANNVKRRIILRDETPKVALIKEIDGFDENKKQRAKFCKTAKSTLGKKISIRELAELTGLSPAGVQHHLKN